MDFWAVVREFGLPLAILAFFVAAILSGALVSGRELIALGKAWADRLVLQAQEYDERLGYVEARRQEEREARLKAEKQLAQVIEATADAQRTMIDLLSDIEKEVIRGSGRHKPGQ